FSRVLPSDLAEVLPVLLQHRPGDEPPVPAAPDRARPDAPALRARPVADRGDDAGTRARSSADEGSGRASRARSTARWPLPPLQYAARAAPARRRARGCAAAGRARAGSRLVPPPVLHRPAR